MSKTKEKKLTTEQKLLLALKDKNSTVHQVDDLMEDMDHEVDQKDFFVVRSSDEIMDDDGKLKSIMQIAVNHSNQEVINYFQNEMGSCDLHLEILKYNPSLDKIRKTVQKNKEIVNHTDKYGMAPLHLAASSGHLEIVRYLIEEGVPAKPRSDGYDPLQHAVRNGKQEVVKYLVETGQFDINYGYKYKDKIINLAALHGTLETFKYLLEQGADTTKKNQQGMTLLHFAAMAKEKDVIQYLIEERGLDVNQATNAGDSLLHYAVWYGYKEVIQYLVEDRKVDINKTNQYGATALHVAAGENREEIISYLATKGADINKKDIKGYSPLGYALTRGHGNIETIKALISVGAEIDLDIPNANAELIKKLIKKSEARDFFIRAGYQLDLSVSHDDKIKKDYDNYQKDCDNHQKNDKNFSHLGTEELIKKGLREDWGLRLKIDKLLEQKTLTLSDFNEFSSKNGSSFAATLENLMTDFFENCESDKPSTKFSNSTMKSIYQLNKTYQELSRADKRESSKPKGLNEDVEERKADNSKQANPKNVLLIQELVDQLTIVKSLSNSRITNSEVRANDDSKSGELSQERPRTSPSSPAANIKENVGNKSKL